MYCIKCGAENSETATYCRKCGALLDRTEVETRVASRTPAEIPQFHASSPVARPAMAGGVETDQTEAEIFAINSTLVFVYAGYAAAAVGALLLVAVTAAFTSISTAWAVLIGLLLFLVPAYYHFRRKLVTYKLTETKLEIDEGLLSRTSRKVPIRAIQDVTITRSIPQRLLGFGNVVIDNASERGGKVTLQNINDPDRYADLILRQMRRAER